MVDATVWEPDTICSDGGELCGPWSGSAVTSLSLVPWGARSLCWYASLSRSRTASTLQPIHWPGWVAPSCQLGLGASAGVWDEARGSSKTGETQCQQKITRSFMTGWQRNQRHRGVLGECSISVCLTVWGDCVDTQKFFSVAGLRCVEYNVSLFSLYHTYARQILEDESCLFSRFGTLWTLNSILL